MVYSLYSALELDNVPFIVGELGNLPYEKHPDVKKNYKEINNQIKEFIKTDSRFIMVSSDGLTANIGDTIHLDAASQRIFGRRYFQAYLEWRDKL